MLTTLHAEAKLNAQARVEQAEAKLADAERATKQLRDQEEAAQRLGIRQGHFSKLERGRVTPSENNPHKTNAE